MAKDTLAQELVALVRKEFGKESALLATGDKGSARSEVSEVIPFGVSPLDHYVLGIGGIPAGRVVEIFSEEGAGKTTLLLALLGSAQREDGLAILQETEDSFALERCKLFGVNTNELLILQPDYIEQALEQQSCVLELLAKLKPKGPSLLGWDSVAATPSKAEVDGDLDALNKDGDIQQGIDPRPKALSKAMRKLSAQARAARCALVYINQVRANIGVMFGDKYTTPGGKAIKFASSIRLQLLGGKAVKRKEEHIGKDITVMAIKNKLASPWRKARLRIMYTAGLDEVWSTLDFAKGDGIVDEKAKGKAAYEEALAGLGWPHPNNAPAFLERAEAVEIDGEETKPVVEESGEN